jgi:hypothetical protein
MEYDSRKREFAEFSVSYRSGDFGFQVRRINPLTHPSGRHNLIGKPFCSNNQDAGQHPIALRRYQAYSCDTGMVVSSGSLLIF